MADQKLIFREWLKDKLCIILGFKIEDDLAEWVKFKLFRHANIFKLSFNKLFLTVLSSTWKQIQKLRITWRIYWTTKRREPRNSSLKYWNAGLQVINFACYYATCTAVLNLLHYKNTSLLVNIEPHSRKKVDVVEEKYQMSNQKNRPLSEKCIKFNLEKPNESEVWLSSTL